MAKHAEFTVRIYEKIPGQARYILEIYGKTYPKENDRELLSAISRHIKSVRLAGG